MFESLGWKANPFLLTKIAFKPPIIDQLAKEAGIDPAVLDLLRKNPDVVAELVARLGSANSPPETDPEADELSNGDVYGGAQDLYGDDMPDIPPGVPDPDGGDGVIGGVGRGGQRSTGTGAPRGGDQGNKGAHGGVGSHTQRGGNASGGPGKRSPGHIGGRPFISYIGAHPNDEEPDPDGLDQAVRMQIEEKAIQLIIGLEPTLHRTPEGNPGFDLYEIDSSGKQVRWVEVKSMTGSLQDRPVGLSRTQFDCARLHEDAYWLYVVELATDSEGARVLRIQNPAGHARTFTFDYGWSQIARTDIPMLKN